MKAEQKAAEKAKKDLANKLKKRKEKAVPIFRDGIVIEGYRLWIAGWRSDTKSYLTNQKIDDIKGIRLFSTSRFRSYKFASRPRLIIDVTLKNEKEFYINYWFEFPRWYNMKQWAEGKASVATMETRFDDAPRFEMKVIDDQVGGGVASGFFIKNSASYLGSKDGKKHSFDYLFFNTGAAELNLGWMAAELANYETGEVAEIGMATDSILLIQSKKSVIAAIDYLMADLGVDAPPGEQILADYIAGQEKEILGGK